jgi:hypothetical protein
MEILSLEIYVSMKYRMIITTGIQKIKPDSDIQSFSGMLKCAEDHAGREKEERSL